LDEGGIAGGERSTRGDPVNALVVLCISQPALRELD
jgi:hypothetical protein